jgi:biopolymer transport protein ExbD
VNFRKKAKLEPLGFQLTPMIDCVFLMLCFFLTSQVYSQWEMEIDIALPTAQTSQAPQRLPGEIIVNVDKAGATVVNGRTLSDEELGSMLKRLAGLFPGQPVLIRADKATAYEHVIRVLDQCRLADIWNISFATGVPEK